MTRKLRRSVFGLAGMLLAGIATTMLLVTPAGGAPAALTFTVAPNTELANGQFVKLTVAGATPGAAFAIRECTGTIADPPTELVTQCTPNQGQSFIVTDGNGNGQGYLPIQAGEVYASASDPRNACSDSNPCFPCDVDDPCLVALMAQPDDLSTAVFAVVQFAPAPDACPHGGDVTSVLGTGSAVAYRSIYKWQGASCLPPKSLAVEYAQKDSYTGVESWLQDIADFPVVGGPLSGDQEDAVAATGKTFAYAPLTGSGLVVAFQIYDQRGPQLTSLKLTPDLVAKIFTGQIRNFNIDPDIAALNPGVHWPPQINPFVRGEHSAQSIAFSQWLTNLTYDDVLSKVTPPWSDVCGPKGTPCAVFPQYPFVTGKQGADAVGLAVADQTIVRTDEGRIGFMDASTAAFYGLPTATIETAPGHDVDPTPEAILAAINDGTVNEDGTVTFGYDDANLDVYPLPMLTYALAPTNKIDPKLGKILAQFLTYAVSDDGQAIQPTGYAKLPANLAAETIAAAKLIPQTTPTTPPPTTPPTTPYYPPTTAPYYPPTTAPYVSPDGTTPYGTGGSSTNPCPTTTPTAGPTPTPTASGGTPLPTTPAVAATPVPGPTHASPTPSGTGASPTPSASASATPVPGPSASPTDPCAAGGGGRSLAILAMPRARYLLPSIALLALIGLTAGPLMQRYAKREKAGGARELMARVNTEAAGGPGVAGGPPSTAPGPGP